MNTNRNEPFAATPLFPENEAMQTMPSAALNEPNAIRPIPAPAQANELENLYPDIYRDVYPLIADAVDKMVASGFALTQDSIGAVVDNIIKNSGLWYEDDDDDRPGMDPEVIPVQFGRGRMPFRRRRRGHHNRNTLRDIIRILLLRELFARRHGFPIRNF